MAELAGSKMKELKDRMFEFVSEGVEMTEQVDGISHAFNQLDQHQKNPWKPAKVYQGNRQRHGTDESCRAGQGLSIKQLIEICNCGKLYLILQKQWIVIMGLIELIQGISAVISIILLIFLDVGRNPVNWVVFLFLCTFFTPIIGLPLYNLIMKH